MLTSIFRALVKNLVKESFYGKRKKKTINVLTAFFIFHKNDVKTFLKWIVDECPKGTRYSLTKAKVCNHQILRITIQLRKQKQLTFP